MRVLTIFTLCLFMQSLVFSQDEQKFFFGVNLGTKFGSKLYAQRYSGGFNDELYKRIMIPEIYNAVRMTINDIDFTLPFDAYPANVRYIPQLLTGAQIGYNIGSNLQVNLEANVSKFKVKEVFTIEVLDPGNTVSQEQYMLGNIYGEESRFTGRINLDYVTSNEKLNYIIGLSVVFSAWRMDQHFATFNNVTIPLFSQFNTTNNIVTGINGNAFGGGINLGVEYPLNDKITCQFMYQPYSAKLDYGYNISNRIVLEHDVVARILWK